MRNTRLATNRPALATIIGVIMLFSINAPAPAYEQQISDQAQTLAEKLAESDRTTLAVVDFTDLQGNVTELGRFLAEELSIGLAGLGQRFEVVDRTHLRAILKENKLSATGLIDPSTAREVGRIAGVGALITGTVTPLGDSVRLAVKVLDTESARIITSSTANIPKTRAIEELLRREIVSGVANSPATGSSEASSNTKTVRTAGFVFELRRCSLSGPSLECSLLVTNNQPECELTINNITRAVAVNGNVVQRPSISFAEDYSSKAVTKTLAMGIPARIDLRFSARGAEFSKLSLLEVGGIASSKCARTGDKDEAFRIQFRDIRVHDS